MKHEPITYMLIDAGSIDLGREINRYREYEAREEAEQLMLSKMTSMAMEFNRTKSIETIKEFIRYWHYSLPPEPPTNYSQEAEDDAKTLITDHFLDEIIQQLIDDDEASDDFNNDYNDGNSIFHETIVDRDYSLTEASELLDQLYDHEEEDEGLWEGVNELNRIAAIKAAYTYGNAVMSKWNNLINEINVIDMDEIRTKATEQILDESDDSHMEDDGVDIGDIDEIIEWCEDNLPDQFNNAMEEILEKEIKEILE